MLQLQLENYLMWSATFMLSDIGLH